MSLIPLTQSARSHFVNTDSIGPSYREYHYSDVNGGMSVFWELFFEDWWWTVKEVSLAVAQHHGISSLYQTFSPRYFFHAHYLHCIQMYSSPMNLLHWNTSIVEFTYDCSTSVLFSPTTTFFNIHLSPVTTIFNIPPSSTSIFLPRPLSWTSIFFPRPLSSTSFSNNSSEKESQSLTRQHKFPRRGQKHECISPYKLHAKLHDP